MSSYDFYGGCRGGCGCTHISDDINLDTAFEVVLNSFGGMSTVHVNEFRTLVFLKVLLVLLLSCRSGSLASLACSFRYPQYTTLVGVFKL